MRICQLLFWMWKIRAWFIDLCGNFRGVRDLSEDELPYSRALRVELPLIGKISLQLGSKGKKQNSLCTYEGENEGINFSSIAGKKEVERDVKVAGKPDMAVVDDNETPGFGTANFAGIMDKNEVFNEKLTLGHWFTWERENLPTTNIQERLDRSVANDQWMSLFPTKTVRHLSHTLSNHCPLLIRLNNGEVKRGQRDFKFKAWRYLEDTFEEVVSKL